VRVETVCTGDELLTGLTSDTNSRFFQAMLLDRLGLTVSRSTVVGDDHDAIVAALTEAAGRAQAVLVSGGLGPTADDITLACAADALGVPLEERAEVRAHIEARFASRRVKLTPNSFRQALMPRGAELALNPEGTAPLVVVKLGGCTCFFVPGVPQEYRHLVEHEVLPRLEALRAQRSPTAPVRVLRVLKTVGLSESHLDARVAPLAQQHGDVTFGFRTHPPENHLKLLAQGATREEALSRLAAAEADCRAALGACVYGADDDTLASVVVAALKARRETLAVAESLTGGLVCAAVTEVAGASDVFPGGAVAYAEAQKTRWAGVPQPLLAQQGAVSEPVALAMAEGVRAATGAAWGLATTGYAGPSRGDETEPVGTVYLAVARGRGSHVERHQFMGDRARVRAFATHAALDLLRRTLQEP